MRVLAITIFAAACASAAPPTDIHGRGNVVESIPSLMEAYEVDGLAIAIVQGDEVLLARGYGETASGDAYDANTECGLYSATKAISSLVYASLAEEGAIDLEANLGALIDDAPEAWRDIAFWRLLNHSSGITMIVNRPIFAEMEANPAAGNEDIYRHIRDLPLDYQPGEHSRYRQSGYAVAEMILSQRMGWDWRDLVERHVTGPARAAHTFHIETHRDAARAPLLASAGGYQTTAHDMGRIFVALNENHIVSPEFLEEFLYNEEYDFDGYSLGGILENVGGVRTLGHRGGGARANIRYAPQVRLGVMVCTDDVSNNDLAADLATLVLREIIEGRAPAMPLRVGLSPFVDAPASELISAYEAEARAEPRRYDFAGAELLLNGLGYRMLAAGRIEDSIAIFTLNTQEYPNSANTFDSLGDALLAADDLPAARASFERALSLDPSSQNAADMIARIEAMMRERGSGRDPE